MNCYLLEERLDMQKIPIEEIIKDIIQSGETIDKLNEKTNQEIANLLRNHIWNHLEVFSPLADLIEITIERLEADNKSLNPTKTEGDFQ